MHNNEPLEAIIEGVLFAIGEAVPCEDLAELCGMKKADMQSFLEKLAVSYQEASRGIQLIQLDDSWQLCTKAQYYQKIEKLVRPRFHQGLSQAALETVAIVAYNQPVTKASIEYIRGVSVDGVLSRLLERGLVEEVGRSDAVGRPILYGTTQDFLRCFGISSLEDLPKVELPIPNADTAETEGQLTMDLEGNVQSAPKEHEE